MPLDRRTWEEGSNELVWRHTSRHSHPAINRPPWADNYKENTYELTPPASCAARPTRAAPRRGRTARRSRPRRPRRRTARSRRSGGPSAILCRTPRRPRVSRARTWPAATCVEINQCVGCTRQFFTKPFLGDDAAVLAPSSGGEPASPGHRAGVASMAWRTTR